MIETVSYEDIYELLRVEKYSTDLQELKPEDIQKIREYFRTKMEMLGKQKEGLKFFDQSQKDKIKLEIENAKKVLKDLYNWREKKLINRALFSSRTDFKLKDSTNMLANENEAYLKMLELLRDNSLTFFRLFDPETASLIENVQPKGLKNENRFLRFIEDVPELIGTDLQKYGPFSKEEMAHIPKEIADLLLKQNKAVVIENENSEADE